ncbi:retroviral-like aspartic protease family protein [Asticcacaulis solisilvae]|uniref:retroviral-like aspartic protease family protein n=1 Tax=Asticcacaulis solisilvae TaxID=1217274 RepID=UPI003FD89782
MAEGPQMRDTSRRDFLALAAALTALGPLGARAQDASASSSSASSGAATDQTTEITSLRTRSDSTLLAAEVKVNGRPYRFIVDTGAERSVLSDTLVNELALEKVGRAHVQGVIRNIPADLVAVKQLDYGTFSKQDMVMPVIPRVLLKADGFLGLDVINNTRVIFDFKHQELRIERSKSMFGPGPADAQVIVIHAPGKAGRLRSNQCVVDGVHTTAFIDTGAELSIGNRALQLALKPDTHPELTPVTLMGVTGGEAVGRLIPIKQISIEELMFTDGDIVISDAPNFEDWGLKDKPAVLIGMDYMRQFASVAIDYRRKEIRFELASAQPDAARPRIMVG